MKFNEEAMKVALDSFMKNDFWREIYEGASETAKKRLRVAFWGSKYLKEKEDLDSYREYRESVEREMTYEDAAYLAEKFPESAGKEHYTEMRDKLEMAPIKTKEKLDAATETLMDGWPAHDRELVAQTQRALEKCTEPWPKYEWVWGAVGGKGEDCEWLGDTFDHGHGVEPDCELAFFWFRRGALCGNGDACGRLAALYEAEGTNFDMEKAKFWFGEGLRRNNDNVKIDLGARLTTWEKGMWTQMRNPTLGMHLLWSATKGDHAGRAHYFLGKCYEQGVGVERDLLNALRHYKIAMKDEVWGSDEAVARVRKLRRAEKRRDRELAEALAEAFGIPYEGGSEADVARVCCRITPELNAFADCSDNEVVATVRIYIAAKVEEDKREREAQPEA